MLASWIQECPAAAKLECLTRCSQNLRQVGERPARTAKLSWFHRVGQIPALSQLCVGPLTLAFVRPDGPTETKEAMALNPPAPPLAITLGGLLLATHCRLCGDAHRICISYLSLISSSLGGTCWTKTSKTGQPFACTHFGLTGGETATAWTVTWLSYLQGAGLETQPSYGSDVEPDFISPAVSKWDASEIPIFRGPLQYHQALPYSVKMACTHALAINTSQCIASK